MKAYNRFFEKQTRKFYYSLSMLVSTSSSSSDTKKALGVSTSSSCLATEKRNERVLASLSKLREELDRSLQSRSISVLECDLILLCAGLILDDRIVIRDQLRLIDDICLNNRLWGAAALMVEEHFQICADGCAPLHFAVMSAVPDNISLLISKGANPLLKNGRNQSALDIAKLLNTRYYI